jgi:hypothetical protein
MTDEGTLTRPFLEWPSYDLTLERERRTSAQWGTDGLIPAYQTWLRALDLDDPTKASTYWARATKLRDDAAAVRPDESRVDLAELLAEGEVTPGDARKMAAKQPDARAAEKEAQERRKLLEDASRTALVKSLQAIYDFGEDGWLGILRPIVAEALANSDDRRFNLAHAFAAWLREPKRNRIFGLAAATNRGWDAEDYLYRVRRPDLLHTWRVERAEATQRQELVRYAVDGKYRVQYLVKPGAVVPMLRDFQPEWGAGLYSAEEVIANVEQSRQAQEAEFARLAAPSGTPPPTEPKRRVVML